MPALFPAPRTERRCRLSLEKQDSVALKLWGWEEEMRRRVPRKEVNRGHLNRWEIKSSEKKCLRGFLPCFLPIFWAWLKNVKLPLTLSLRQGHPSGQVIRKTLRRWPLWGRISIPGRVTERSRETTWKQMRSETPWGILVLFPPWLSKWCPSSKAWAFSAVT